MTSQDVISGCEKAKAYLNWAIGIGALLLVIGFSADSIANGSELNPFLKIGIRLFVIGGVGRWYVWAKPRQLSSGE